MAGLTSAIPDTLCQLAVESLPIGVLVLDAGGVIRAVNRQIERLSGSSRDELVGRPVGDVLDADDAGTSPRTGSGPYGRRRDGSRVTIEVSLQTVQTASGPLVVVTVVDLTGERQADDDRKREIEAQLRFERLFAELSTQFINVAFDEVDGAIREALRRIGEALDLDRCAFYELAAAGAATRGLGWERDGIRAVPAAEWSPDRFPWTLQALRAGRIASFSRLDEIPEPADRAGHEALGTRAGMLVPLSVAGRVVGVVVFSMVRGERAWRPEDRHRLEVSCSAFASVLARRQGDAAMHGLLAEMQRLREQLNAENATLRREAQEQLGAGAIVGQSAAVRRVLEQLHQVAQTDSTVLLLGETGTGKELFATQIHHLSRRRDKTMVRVNCAAIPDALMESELFGREKGAFTGALARQIGRFELADHSTIFLDEIGDLHADIQVKLLRVLEERQLERLGSPKPIHVDARIIAATHRNLEKLIAENAFREDLYYRLNVFPIHVPPLRERAEDIPLLVWRFVGEFSRTFGKRIEAITPDNLSALQRYPWPGNIRELRNVVERAMIVASGTRLTIPVPTATGASERHSLKLTDVEKKHIRSVLESTGWRVRGTGGAADRLGLRPTTLETRMAKLGLTRPKPA